MSGKEKHVVAMFFFKQFLVTFFSAQLLKTFYTVALVHLTQGNILVFSVSLSTFVPMCVAFAMESHVDITTDKFSWLGA